jgi:hypothetical protein
MNAARTENAPNKNNDLQPGRLCALVLKLPPCGDDPRVLVKLLYANARGVCVQYVRADHEEHHVVWYGATRFYSWNDVAGLHVATPEASERFFTRTKGKKRNTAA